MLDHYISGVAKRLSPEAPVPIINVNDNVAVIGNPAREIIKSKKRYR